jgi:hypothetical protein
MRLIILMLLCVVQVIAVFWLAQELLSLRVPWRTLIFGGATDALTSAGEPSDAINPSSPDADADSPPPRYDRVVVMMVDALRQDMVHERNEMEHVRAQLMHAGSKCALGFIAHAQSPTVTMPRIKALMTGLSNTVGDLQVALLARVFICLFAKSTNPQLLSSPTSDSVVC